MYNGKGYIRDFGYIYLGARKYVNYGEVVLQEAYKLLKMYYKSKPVDICTVSTMSCGKKLEWLSDSLQLYKDALGEDAKFYIQDNSPFIVGESKNGKILAVADRSVTV